MKKIVLNTLLATTLLTSANAMDKCGSGKCGSDKKMDMKKEMTKFYQLNSKGEMLRPKDYRTWVYIGTPVTPNDLNGGHAAFPEIHNVI